MTPNELHELAVATDTQLAELWQQETKLYSQQDSNKLSLARHAGIKPEYVGRSGRQIVRESTVELVAMVEALKANMMPWELRDAEASLAKVTELQDALAANRAAAAPLEDLYHEHQWSRFFLVQNTNGHIHSSMHCHSCTPRTQYGWLPMLSGLTEKDAVDAHGTVLCSHCYPSAPVEWTLGIQKEADPNQCPGSGTYDFDRAPGDRRRYQECKHCHTYQNVTSTGKLRKHKVAA